MSEKRLTMAEAAERLRSSKRFVYNEITRKNLRASKTGPGWTIAESDLQTYIDAHANVTLVRGRS